MLFFPPLGVHVQGKVLFPSAKGCGVEKWDFGELLKKMYVFHFFKNIFQNKNAFLHFKPTFFFIVVNIAAMPPLPVAHCGQMGWCTLVPPPAKL